ncbi:hypothetical protein [Streptomyces sp. NPDC048603]|uniref:hypothetical protein n=1 Tax=Streptomyces sp. NPDC048603 TaxID=3365577 RepID=UPI00371D642C
MPNQGLRIGPAAEAVPVAMPAGDTLAGMATLRTSPGRARSRRPAGARPLPRSLRLLWPALLLFGFLYTHGVNAETTASHLAGHAVVVTDHRAAAADAAPHGHEDRGEGNRQGQDEGGDEDGRGGGSHPAGTCVSGQPPEAAGAEIPAPVLLAWACHRPEDRTAAPVPGPELPAALPPGDYSARSVVQRI